MILPSVRELFLGLESGPAFRALLTALAPEGASAQAGGLIEPARALYALLLGHNLGRPVLLLTASNKSAESLFELANTFHEFAGSGPAPVLLPAHDLLPYDGLSPHPDISEKRAIALWKMARGQASLVVAPIASAVMRLEAASFYANLALDVRRGDSMDIESLAAHLVSVGYARRDPVEMVGQFSVRGGIFDVFSAETARPVRLELFGDEVESIREFDPVTQRSVAPREVASFLPLTDFPVRPQVLRDLDEDGRPFPGWEFLTPLVTPFESTVFDLMDRTLVALDEPDAVWTALDKLWQRLDDGHTRAGAEARLRPEQLYLRREPFEERLARMRRAGFAELALADSIEFRSQPSPRFHGNIPLLVEDLRRRAESGSRTLFLAPTAGDVERLADIFKEYEVGFQLGTTQFDAAAHLSSAAVVILKGIASSGVSLPDDRLTIFGNNDLFDVSDLVVQPGRARAKSAPGRLATFLGDFRDLAVGDFVVHVENGIGRYLGLREIVVGDGPDKVKEEFMVLEYAEDARLYVPLTRLDVVQKYRSLGETDIQPKLDKLGGIVWEKTRARARKGMREMAEELLKLYAARKVAGGHAFSADSHWQGEFEDGFEFSETVDQATVIGEVKKDMESNQPMDRLLCGDVGYGKTEVAMRAAMKAMSDSKQVAVLAPTTVLAFQHFENFRQRFAPFPVRIDMLSRFRTSAEIKASLADIESGKVDLVIGTHRLLSKDVIFRDLGLLVVDEEQRFGVRHKERIKQMRKQVDVLTMSATPIPRTLNMSLVGLRDMSVIETPPKDRLSIQTVVAPVSDKLVRTALEQELARGGQAFFVHNRVESIFTIAAWIQQLVPQARISVGHGQMEEKQLEKVMLGFVRHQSDILVATTIIENGLDIPLCNTILVNRADRMGLSELYQLRGRVGRSNRRAYAYLLVPTEGELTPLARRRLSALKEFSDLGAGFKIAALDLELRGAGNLLGGQQHGHIHAIGFDLYCTMLERTVRELKGEDVAPEVSTVINLGVNLRIPDDYVPDERQRLRIYKQIAGAEDRAAMEKELEDRYGPPPPSVLQLLDYAGLRAVATRLAIRKIERRRGMLHVEFHQDAPADPKRLMDFLGRREGSQFSPAGVLSVPIAESSGPGILMEVRSVLENFVRG